MKVPGPCVTGPGCSQAGPRPPRHPLWSSRASAGRCTPAPLPAPELPAGSARHPGKACAEGPRGRGWAPGRCGMCLSHQLTRDVACPPLTCRSIHLFIRFCAYCRFTYFTDFLLHAGIHSDLSQSVCRHRCRCRHRYNYSYRLFPLLPHVSGPPLCAHRRFLRLFTRRRGLLMWLLIHSFGHSFAFYSSIHLFIHFYFESRY